MKIVRCTDYRESQAWAHRWWELQRADRTNLTNGLTNLTSQPFQPSYSFYMVKNIQHNHNMLYEAYSAIQSC